MEEDAKKSKQSVHKFIEEKNWKMKKNLLSTCLSPQTSASAAQHNHQILLSNPTPTTENEKYKNQ